MSEEWSEMKWGDLITLEYGKSLTQLENSVPINQLKSIISIYFSGPKGV